MSWGVEAHACVKIDHAKLHRCTANSHQPASGLQAVVDWDPGWIVSIPRHVLVCSLHVNQYKRFRNYLQESVDFRTDSCILARLEPSSNMNWRNPAGSLCTLAHINRGQELHSLRTALTQDDPPERPPMAHMLGGLRRKHKA